MVELIATIILLGSLIGMGVIFGQKMPILAELPEVPAKFDLKTKFLKIKEKIKNSRYYRTNYFEILLQKFLSRIRILTLKAENKMSSWLQRLRERTKKKKIKENDNYWEEVKKINKK